MNILPRSAFKRAISRYQDDDDAETYRPPSSWQREADGDLKLAGRRPLLAKAGRIWAGRDDRIETLRQS